MDIDMLARRLSAIRAKQRRAVQAALMAPDDERLLEQALLLGERLQRIEQEMARNGLLLRLGKDAPPDRLLCLLLNEDAPQKDAPQRQRKPSDTALIKRARKAGERGPITITLPDGRSITSEREASVAQMTEADAETLWKRRVAKNAAH
jgi:hypothetical protein